MNMEIYRNLLYALLTTEPPCTGSTLCQAACISPKTLRKYIREINDMISPSGVWIDGKVGVGYTMQYKNLAAHQEIRRQIVNQYLRSHFYKSSARNRLHFIVRKLLIQEKISLWNLADEMFYSDVTVLKDMAQVEKHLREFHIALAKSRGDVYSICGDEWDIRMCFIHERTVYEHNSVLSYYLDQKFEQSFFADRVDAGYLMDILEDELGEDYMLTVANLEYLVAFIQLSLARIERESQMPFLRPGAEKAPSEALQTYCTRVYDRIRGELGLTARPEDVMGLGILVEAYNENVWETVDSHLLNEADLAGYLERYYPHLFQRTSGDSRQHTFLQMIIRKLDRIVYRRERRIYTNYSESQQIQATGLRYLAICVCLAQYIEENLGISLNRQEITQMYFIAATYVRKMYGNEDHTCRILVVTALEWEHQELLCHDILEKDLFPSVRCIAISYLNRKKYDPADYDYIFTDYMGDLTAWAGNTPVVGIYFRNNYFNPFYQVGEDSLSRYILKQIFREELFFRAEEIEDREGAFDFIRENVLPVLGLSNGYLEEIQRQENILSFERGNRLAILLPYSRYNMPDYLCVICCRKPFTWADREVQYILLGSNARNPEKNEFILSSALLEALHDSTHLDIPWEQLNYERVLDILASLKFNKNFK